MIVMYISSKIDWKVKMFFIQVRKSERSKGRSKWKRPSAAALARGFSKIWNKSDFRNDNSFFFYVETFIDSKMKHNLKLVLLSNSIRLIDTVRNYETELDQRSRAHEVVAKKLEIKTQELHEARQVRTPSSSGTWFAYLLAHWNQF